MSRSWPDVTSSPDRLVIGLDSSTQSAKAIAWDRAGHAVAEGRAAVPLSNPSLGRFEQDPEDWWRAARDALRGCVRQAGAERIEALAIANQRETVAFLDADGHSVYPALTWLDERARVEVREVSESLGADTVHRITGRYPDLILCLYRIRWIQKHEPEVWERTACFADAQAYLVQRLAGGEFRTSWTSADPFGLFDVSEKRWSPVILGELGLDASRLPRTEPPGTELGRVSSAAAAETGLREGTPIIAAGGDGQCAGLGTNCTTPERSYINLGTAVVSGVWSPGFKYDRAWRTEIAAQGEGYIFENCLRSGAFLVNWFVDQFVRRGADDIHVFERLEREALEVPIGCEGLMAQPYWSGVMDPHWDFDARGVLVGLSGSHKPVHIYRALIEAITFHQVMRTQSLEATAGLSIDHFVAIGGGAHSPLWRQMLADASGKPVLVSDTVEASALGAGMIAATAAGWYGSIVQAAEAMSGRTRAVLPNEAASARYAKLLDIYRNLYQATQRVNSELVAFAHGEG